LVLRSYRDEVVGVFAYVFRAASAVTRFIGMHKGSSNGFALITTCFAQFSTMHLVRFAVTKIDVPRCVGISWVSMMSFNPTGTP
jgi:hypothetical protein